MAKDIVGFIGYGTEAEIWEALKSAEKLKPRAAAMFKEYYSNPNATLKSIGTSYGISQEVVRQHIYKIGSRIRVILASKLGSKPYSLPQPFDNRQLKIIDPKDFKNINIVAISFYIKDGVLGVEFVGKADNTPVVGRILSTRLKGLKDEGGIARSISSIDGVHVNVKNVLWLMKNPVRSKHEHGSYYLTIKDTLVGHSDIEYFLKRNKPLLDRAVDAGKWFEVDTV